jgi:plastocyanin
VSLSPLHIVADDEHAELVFEVAELGECVFYCSVPGHREVGMEGKIVVEEQALPSWDARRGIP